MMGDEDYLDLSDGDDILCSSKYISSDEEEFDFSCFIPKTKKDKYKVEDDFEKEMAAELSLTMESLKASFSKSAASDSRGISEKDQDAGLTKKKGEEGFYDDVYFDSDDSETYEDPTTPVIKTQSNRSKKKEKEKRRIMSNDELFYDPDMDDRDQAWVDKQRRSYQVKKKRESGFGCNKLQPLPQSDAVLNCPACLTSLCFDCQRHEIYKSQYRAMFVFNCKIDMSETLKFPKTNGKKSFLKDKKKARKQMQSIQLVPNTKLQCSSNVIGKSKSPSLKIADNIVEENARPKIVSNNLNLFVEKKVVDSKSQDLIVKNEAVDTESEDMFVENEAVDTESEDLFVENETVDTKSQDLFVKNEAVDTKSEDLFVENETVDTKSRDLFVKNEAVDTKSQVVKTITAENHDVVSTMDMFSEDPLNENLMASLEVKSVSSKSLLERMPDEDELFHPVTCKICNTKVAVYDKDEIYHFFNIVTSY